MCGYAGKILFVDLSSGQIREEALELEDAKKYIGGFGMNTVLAYRAMTPGVNPLDPGNVVVFGAGALAGTPTPGSSRVVATTKFPETGAIATGNGSMGFASQLKYAGYDHVVITGKAAHPVYLLVEDGRAMICDAQRLWGKGIVDATNDLWETYGTQSGVIAIGQAGENMVDISLALVDRMGSLGKGGLGAVMGSKHLKAVVARGSGSVKIADRKKYLEMVDRYLERIKKYDLRENWLNLGMMQGWSDALRGGFPYLARTELYPNDKLDELYGMDVYLNKVKKGHLACPSCPMADKEILQYQDGEGQCQTVFSSGWFARNIDYGVRGGAATHDGVVECIQLSNQYGIDSHSVGIVIDYATYLFNQGVINRADTGGLELKQDLDTTKTLLKLIAFREGFGAVLAGGVRKIAEQFGQQARQHTAHIKGLELIQDPRVRGMGTMEFETVVNPRGGHHSSGGSPAYSIGSSMEKFAMHCDRMGASGDAIKRILGSDGFNVARLTRYAEDWYAVLCSLGLCNRAQINRFHSAAGCAELYSTVTGLELSLQELMTAAERSWNLLKALNVREGFGREHDVFPDKWFEPIKDTGGKELRLRDYYGKKFLGREDVGPLLDEYYDERGWDLKKGIPTREKLEQLGLEGIAGELYS